MCFQKSSQNQLDKSQQWFEQLLQSATQKPIEALDLQSGICIPSDKCCIGSTQPANNIQKHREQERSMVFLNNCLPDRLCTMLIQLSSRTIHVDKGRELRTYFYTSSQLGKEYKSWTSRTNIRLQLMLLELQN